ncbi:MAG: SGNH/GDSL hydrolase family protein, partial [Pseudomonadota bacterium]
LLWQGRQVRGRILRMPEPEGTREGIAGSGPALSVLILGDSAAAGVGAATQEQALSGRLLASLSGQRTVHWRLIATTGWTTADAIAALDGLQGQHFDAVVLSAGVNDVTTETGIGRWLDLYRRLIERLKADHGARVLIVNQMPPMGRFPALPQPLRWYLGRQARAHDRALGDLVRGIPGCARPAMDFRRYDANAGAEDGFHPGPEIYADWAAEAAAIILDRLPEAEVGVSVEPDPGLSPSSSA